MEMDTFINFDKLDKIIDEYNPEEFGIFSYAITDSTKDQQFSTSNLMKVIREKAGNRYVRVVLTTSMGEYWYKQHVHKYLDVHPRTIWHLPKEYAFLMMVREIIRKEDNEIEQFILFDDTSPHGLKYTISDKVQVIYLNPNYM